MAADEVLLSNIRSSHPALRFYTWTEPTLSLGYFQPYSSCQANPGWQSLPVVRRATGGGTLLHHHELTYALALAAKSLKEKPTTWLFRMHQVIAKALDNLGICVHLVSEATEKTQPVLCFHKLTPGDILCAGHKVVGSAQKKQRQGLLQHGAILLQTSPLAPTLPGIFDLTGKKITFGSLVQAIQIQVEKTFGWTMEETAWSETEREEIARLANWKYESVTWNRKR